MNPQSALQQQYPLSRKKFLKKMIQGMSVWYFLGLIAAIIGIVILFSDQDAATTSDGTLLWSGLIILVLLLAAGTVFYSLYIKSYIKNYFYAGEEHFITIKKGVFAPAEIHVQWQKIQDVYVDQDILDRIMGLYDVHIASATAASGIEAHIDGVDQQQAEGLKHFLLDKVSGSGKNTTQGSASAPTATATVASQAVTFNQEISNVQYPLSSKWMTMSLIGKLIGSVVYAVFVAIIFFSKSDNESFSEYWTYYVLGWIGLSILIMAWQTIALFLWKKNYAFTFTPENIYYREGVLSLSEKHMPYSSIQDVTVQQSILERLFGLAKVSIENASQQTQIVGRGRRVAKFTGVLLQGLSLEDANKITEVLKTTVLGKNSTQYGL